MKNQELTTVTAFITAAIVLSWVFSLIIMGIIHKYYYKKVRNILKNYFERHILQ